MITVNNKFMQILITNPSLFSNFGRFKKITTLFFRFFSSGFSKKKLNPTWYVFPQYLRHNSLSTWCSVICIIFKLLIINLCNWWSGGNLVGCILTAMSKVMPVLFSPKNNSISNTIYFKVWHGWLYKLFFFGQLTLYMNNHWFELCLGQTETLEIYANVKLSKFKTNRKTKQRYIFQSFVLFEPDKVWKYKTLWCSFETWAEQTKTLYSISRNMFLVCTYEINYQSAIRKPTGRSLEKGLSIGERGLSKGRW